MERMDDVGPVDPPILSGESYPMYFPVVRNGETVDYETYRGQTYYYAGSSFIAMRTIDGEVIWLYGDHLGSTSVTADRHGNELSCTKYYAWGTTWSSTGDTQTDYAYTGQMKVDDIYYYNARWYDPEIGRFMQADTLVPGHQGTQGFDRYAYVNNNPLMYTDPSGHWFRNTNLMLTDGGAASSEGHVNNIRNNYNWDVRGEWSFDELADLNGLGLKLEQRISSINGGNGKGWIRINTAGIVFEKNTFTQKMIMSLLNLFSNEPIAGVVPSPIIAGQVYVDSKYNSQKVLCHEMIHVIDNIHSSGWFAATWAGGGPADAFINDMGGAAHGIRWNNMVNVSPANILPKESGLQYSNNATAEYFAELFTDFLLNPNTNLPTNIVDWFIDFIIRTTP